MGLAARRGIWGVVDLQLVAAMLLDSSFGHLPLVTVSGRVRSDTPLTGQQSGLQASIVEQHVTQHYLKKTPKKAGEEYLVVKKIKEKCGDEHLMIKEEEKDDVGQLSTKPYTVILTLGMVFMAFKDNSGKITIQRPRNGGPFHVSSCSIDQIISGLGSEARCYQFCAVAFAASGMFLFGGYALN
ncbi:uncharacterized protein LOC101776502 [Setaria italica]|uniref:uncharacterized protein LOC101776502 n=1 Tax=Setaria italica TaxID=4555 RepID=UPI0007199DC7|nr:uncharacterized protein LOC101776502 [Setaria italica]